MKVTVFNYSVIKNQQDASILDVFIDGDIVDASTQEFYKNWWGDDTSTSFKSFRDQILNSDATRINVNINSGGGMVADALAIHDFIKEQIANGKNIHTYGKGIVASAATYPLLAGGDNCHISENCFFMIHNVYGSVSGTVDEVEAGAKMMRKFNDCARDLYASYFNKPKETISNWMNAETWWTGTDMKNNGFIKNTAPAANVLTNAIPKEKWLFTNTTVLNTINNSISAPQQKEKGMKKNKIINAISEAFKKLNINNDAALSTIKVGEFREALTNSLAAEEDEDVTTEVTNALKGDIFQGIVNTAVDKRLETIPANFTEAITNATKDVATKTDLDKLTNDVAEKLGTPRNKRLKNGTVENESPEDVVANADGWNR